MVAFEITINGKKVCTVGVDAIQGLMESRISWSKRDLSSLPEEVRKKVPEEEIRLLSGGQAKYSNSRYESLKWKGRKLLVGDEIRIKILETDKIDEPISREVYNPKDKRINRRS